MGDDAEYYFETMMQDPEFRREQEELEEKQKKDENLKRLVVKHKSAVLCLYQQKTNPNPNEICKQLGINRSVYYACLETIKK